MAEFGFITAYIDKLPQHLREDSSYPFNLPPGCACGEITELDDVAGVPLPNELLFFYEFSYGAQLGEYRILTAEEICEYRSILESTYGSDWNFDLIPFARVIDTGDFLLLDPARAEGESLAILDGFHELPPEKWKVICYGIQAWLKAMVESEFTPYWLSDSDNDDA
jgi:hypothetical protein